METFVEDFHRDLCGDLCGDFYGDFCVDFCGDFSCNYRVLGAYLVPNTLLCLSKCNTIYFLIVLI